jgi:hypothetical protein
MTQEPTVLTKEQQVQALVSVYNWLQNFGFVPGNKTEEWSEAKALVKRVVESISQQTDNSKEL